MSQLEGRIKNQILGVKGLTRCTQRHSTLQRLLLPTSETKGSVFWQWKGEGWGGGYRGGAEGRGRTQGNGLVLIKE